MRFYFLALILLILQKASCQNQSILFEYFNDKEIIEVHKIIDYYDSFVLSFYDNEISLDRAYTDFLKKTTLKSLEEGDLSYLIPNEEERIIFFNSLDKKNLSRIYIYSDSIEVYNIKNEAKRKINVPYYFSYNSRGTYSNFIKKLSEKKTFYKNYFYWIDSSGDFTPSLYQLLLTRFGEIDFNIKEEKLSFIIPFIFLNKKNHNLKKDEVILNPKLKR